MSARPHGGSREICTHFHSPDRHLHRTGKGALSPGVANRNLIIGNDRCGRNRSGRKQVRFSNCIPCLPNVPQKRNENLFVNLCSSPWLDLGSLGAMVLLDRAMVIATVGQAAGLYICRSPGIPGSRLSPMHTRRDGESSRVASTVCKRNTCALRLNVLARLCGDSG